MGSTRACYGGFGKISRTSNEDLWDYKGFMAMNRRLRGASVVTRADLVELAVTRASGSSGAGIFRMYSSKQ